MFHSLLAFIHSMLSPLLHPGSQVGASCLPTYGMLELNARNYKATTALLELAAHMMSRGFIQVRQVFLHDNCCW